MEDNVNELYSNTTFSDDILSNMGGYNNERLGFTTTTPQTIDEAYDRNIADRIAIELTQKEGFNAPKYIGAGAFGVAYDIGDGMVLKITSDKSEAMENLNIMGKSLKRIAEPYHIYSVTSESDTIKDETYAIVLEKLKTDFDNFLKKFNRLKFIFSNIFNVSYADWFDHYFDNYSTYGILSKIEQINKYFESNPNDYEYLKSLIEINNELVSNNITSKDFMNPANLGYKNGLIAFFDIGFGNYFSTSNNKPKEITVSEDGTTKFSTQSSMDGLDYPTQSTIMFDDNVDENKQKAWVAGGSTVEIKDKCRLGGLGNTSAKCNQGDINNLIIKPIKK